MRVAIRSTVSAVAAAVVLILGQAASAEAQVLGTFRWALLPYCNVLTMLVEQKGAVYQLSGTDDQCGAAVAAAANGTAHLNPNGTASISLTVIRPDGISIPSTASISLVTLSGTWSDEYGNSGSFTFNPAGAAGSPRRVTLRGSFGVVTTAQAAGNEDTSIVSFPMQLATAPQSPAANFILFGGAPTANCPGSFSDPQALPGQLCFYERVRNNVSSVGAFPLAGGGGVVMDRTGAILLVRATAVGQFFTTGKWAVTLP